MIAIHNHQPVGNFDYLIEDSYRKAYLPFLETLERHPRIKVVLHYCGVLYSFFKSKHPEFLELLATLLRRGQIEILTGGFYEPILPILPEPDRLGQLRKMNDWIKRHLSYTPKGVWVAERVWEPHMPTLLYKAGVQYTTLDDFHFKLSGLKEEDLTGYFITEDGEATLGIFPGSERLRYLIPFRLPEETIRFLSESASEGKVAIAVADDGEKFGVWPETYRSVYEEGWLERFFLILEENQDWIETITFSEYWERNPPRGRIYLPTTSYREMGGWALPPDAIKEYEDLYQRLGEIAGTEKARTLLRGGFWRNFFSKYPESNNLHKKMLYVSSKVHKARLKTQMLDELYQGQCNDAYWHGVFGGLYLPHLRGSIYKHLIRAEAMADSLIHKGKSWLEVDQIDFDLDSRPEVLIETPLMNIYIDPEAGGTIFEWDWKPKAINILNTFSRREEGYHYKIPYASGNPAELKTIHERIIVKEEGLEKFLRYDRYRRVSLIDHFLSSDTTFLSFKDGEYQEIGDFLDSPYGPSIKKRRKGLILTLKRDGRVDRNTLSLKKTIIVKQDSPSIEIGYEIIGGRKMALIFGVEFNFALSGKGPGRYFRIHGLEPPRRDILSHGSHTTVKEVDMVDEWLGITITLKTEPEMDLWLYPVETVSQSEGGFERVYQCSTLFPHLTLDTDGNYWKGRFTLSVVDIK